MLGTAAGGGLPQWNCRCATCDLARRGYIPRRTQSCVAIAVSADRWVLVNASPDFPAQIEQVASSHLSTAAAGTRRNPVAAVLLTNADLDHVLGLVAMRESPSLAIHATRAVRQTLEQGLSFATLLGSFVQIDWREATGEPLPLLSGDDEAFPIEYRAIFLSGGPPPYARSASLGETGHSLAYEFFDRTSGKRLVVAPDVGEVSAGLLDVLQSADAVLFDGTFWKDDELQAVRAGARSARAMGHLPISDGSLDLLASLRAPLKSYLHINNTNPILNPVSPERAALTAAGIRLEEDGTEWTL